MLVGEDFDKITWNISNLELLEPNAFIGDTILFLLALFFAFRIRKMSRVDEFYNNWFWFFIIFGVSLFIGGLGHLFYNYWGVQGKYFSWYTSIIAVYYIEQAMISLHRRDQRRLFLVNCSIYKLIISLIALTIIIMQVDLVRDVSKGLIIPSLNSIIGMVGSLVLLTIYYQRLNKGSFKMFRFGVLVLLPAAFFQFLKINLAQWFDRNDASHVLLAITFIFYFIGIMRFQKNASKPFVLKGI